ncbi:TPA: alpha/beta fold hydrolase [Vibrio cholerae]
MKNLTLLCISSLFFSGYTLAASTERINNIILVHGAYADGSGWQKVFKKLKEKNYNVYVSQLPETSLSEDVANINRLINYVGEDVVLVGHSYGGIVISEAGNHDRVKRLVYIAAVVPDANENIASLRQRYKAPADDIVQLGDGFRMLNPVTFHADFAADVPKDIAEFMAYSQTPIAVPYALGTKITKAAWKDKPSWFLLPTEDRKINPELLRFMAKRAESTVTETQGSHAIFISQPDITVEVIEKASINIMK